MIYAIKIKCSECNKVTVLFIAEDQKIKTPYICGDCFSNIKRNEPIIKEFDLGIEREILEYNMFMGYTHKAHKMYKPIKKEMVK